MSEAMPASSRHEDRAESRVRSSATLSVLHIEHADVMELIAIRTRSMFQYGCPKRKSSEHHDGIGHIVETFKIRSSARHSSLDLGGSRRHIGRDSVRLYRRMWFELPAADRHPAASSIRQERTTH